MIDITTWVEQFLRALDARFAGRTWFVGLQGSYGRDEATETSDIDLVVILDELTAADIPSYNAMLDTLPHRELICGFLSGKEEILHWDAADLFQFYHDTTPIRGTLDSLLLLIDDAAVQRAIHMGPAISSTAACTTCSTRRARTSCAGCTRRPPLSCRRLPTSKPERTSAARQIYAMPLPPGSRASSIPSSA